MNAGKQIDFDTAVTIATRYLDESSGEPGSLQIVPALTVEREYGWGFVYNSAEYVATHNDDFLLASIEPFLVLRNGGGIVEFDSGQTIEEALDEYERTRGLR